MNRHPKGSRNGKGGQYMSALVADMPPAAQPITPTVRPPATLSIRFNGSQGCWEYALIGPDGIPLANRCRNGDGKMFRTREEAADDGKSRSEEMGLSSSLVEG